MDCDFTYEDLAAYAAGELPAGRAEALKAHASDCGRCRDRLEALRRADAALSRLSPDAPPIEAVLGTRRALTKAVRAVEAPEIMTLDEVAEFLRVGADELDEIAEELPAFELAGRLRVRRQRLMEWIEQRESSYARSAAAAMAGRATTGWLAEG